MVGLNCDWHDVARGVLCALMPTAHMHTCTHRINDIFGPHSSALSFGRPTLLTLYKLVSHFLDSISASTILAKLFSAFIALHFKINSLNIQFRATCKHLKIYVKPTDIYLRQVTVYNKSHPLSFYLYHIYIKV